MLVASQVTALSAQNLLINPDFDHNIDGWQVIGGTVTWDNTLDAGGSPSSGSARAVFDALNNTGLVPGLSQCVPLTIGASYTVGGQIFITPGGTAPGSAFFILVGYPTSGCSGPPPPGPSVQTPPVTAIGSWTSSTATFTNSFANSGQVLTVLAPLSGGHLQANFDKVIAAPASSACVADEHTLCLLGSRFKVTAVYDNGAGLAGDAHVRPVGNSGNLWFFDPGNLEALVKVLPGCSLGGHFWFFAAGLTNLHVVITVQDMQTGVVKTYANPPNTAFRPIQDTSAFSCP